VTDEITWLQQAYDLIAKYRTETTLTALWLLNPVFTFMLVQRIKRIAPEIKKRRLNGFEVATIATITSILLTLIVGHVFAGLSLDVLATHAILIAIALPTLVRLLMGRAKAKHPELYEALRNDRRSPRSELVDVPVDRREDTTMFL